MFHYITLGELQHIKRWHVLHKAGHRLEYELLDLVLTLWMMGWVGWLPAALLDAPWAFPICALGMGLPSAYVGLRARAHAARRLRCDWL